MRRQITDCDSGFESQGAGEERSESVRTDQRFNGVFYVSYTTLGLLRKLEAVRVRDNSLKVAIDALCSLQSSGVTQITMQHK